jgi:hypothetical protein
MFVHFTFVSSVISLTYLKQLVLLQLQLFKKHIVKNDIKNAKPKASLVCLMQDAFL